MNNQSQAAEVIRFPCASCAGPMAFDAESQCLKCRYCGSEQPIAGGTGEPVEHPFEGGEDETLLDWGAEQRAIRCEACGGETWIPATQTASACVFCGSPKVLAQEGVRSLRPESLIPFQLTRESFSAWKKKRWFLPNDFKKADVSSQLNGIYIPYWTFDAETYSVYSAEVGVYHYRTVTRTRVVNGKTETYTETERYTVWHYRSGDYDRSFDDILVPASGHYDGTLLRKLGDFRLGELRGYAPEYLSGFISERYSVSREQGWDRAREEADGALNGEIRSRLGGDEIRHLSIRTSYDKITYKHLLLPVWNANYAGQTGTVSGRVPRSAAKIASFSAACLSVVGAVAWFLASHPEYFSS